MGRSVLTRMVCSILSVGPLIYANAANSVFRNSRRRVASVGSCGIMPARSRPMSSAVVFWRGGSGMARLNCAHRSIPIRAGLSRVGRILNVCRRVLPCTVTGSETRPEIVALVPSANCKWISPSPFKGRILRSRARFAVSASIMDISEPVSSNAGMRRPSNRIVTCGRGVNLTWSCCRAGALIRRPRPRLRFPAVGSILACGLRPSRTESRNAWPGGDN